MHAHQLWCQYVSRVDESWTPTKNMFELCSTLAVASRTTSLLFILRTSLGVSLMHLPSSPSRSSLLLSSLIRLGCSGWPACLQETCWVIGDGNQGVWMRIMLTSSAEQVWRNYRGAAVAAAVAAAGQGTYLPMWRSNGHSPMIGLE
jgi:hypothetical protein